MFRLLLFRSGGRKDVGGKIFSVVAGSAHSIDAWRLGYLGAVLLYVASGKALSAAATFSPTDFCRVGYFGEMASRGRGKAGVSWLSQRFSDSSDPSWEALSEFSSTEMVMSMAQTLMLQKV